jgi:hypothetical protein
MPTQAKPPRTVLRQLAAFFRRNGYVRRQNAKRLRREKRTYKKGDEVRLVAESWKELQAIRGLLREAGFAPSRPFRKANQWRQPLYGRDDVARFLAYVQGV